MWNVYAIVSGGFLGWGAGLLWTAQGALMLAYAPEAKKGMYIRCVVECWKTWGGFA